MRALLPEVGVCHPYSCTIALLQQTLKNAISAKADYDKALRQFGEKAAEPVRLAMNSAFSAFDVANTSMSAAYMTLENMKKNIDSTVVAREVQLNLLKQARGPTAYEIDAATAAAARAHEEILASWVALKRQNEELLAQQEALYDSEPASKPSITIPTKPF